MFHKKRIIDSNAINHNNTIDSSKHQINLPFYNKSVSEPKRLHIHYVSEKSGINVALLTHNVWAAKGKKGKKKNPHLMCIHRRHTLALENKLGSCCMLHNPK